MDCLRPIVNVTNTTTYFLNVTDTNGCSAIDEMTIFINNDCGNFFVPNVFSPNGDGQNDMLYVKRNCINNFLIVAYDRWGQKVFETQNLSLGWDGRRNGKAFDPGVFVYELDVDFVNGETHSRSGNFSLVR